ncbi:HNH endonuclease domain-containing protein [Erwinia sp. B116]|uniref:HNH endonuclease domain-containing protein n=1 Tax=Erwinia sp. B116 TaxID=1561024 RepID=UPI000C767858|nr:HNH endonuclease domain-containing protein [Erwinia sp. B116]PLV48297.1 HNH endonuclease [Erwinia sp. B116]
MHFYQVDPTLENYWRGIILFGRNVASYKFALAKALYELRHAQSELITLDDLALPFARHICEHLQQAPKQNTSKQSQFLNACNAFNRGELDPAALQAATVKLGFGAVIDAFHNVNNGEIDKRFFLDERRSHKGIRLTDNFFRLTESEQFANLLPETEARWRLVEQAWALGVSRNMIAVEYDAADQMLFSRQGLRRTAITSCRDSLNGYQKGKCFYCYRSISIVSGDDALAQVDHFLPWSLMPQGILRNLDGVWNLVLACRACNGSKSARIPSVPLLSRLHTRNEYFINSHLPLRETLLEQTGKSEKVRRQYLNDRWNTARQSLLHTWEPEAQGEATF